MDFVNARLAAEKNDPVAIAKAKEEAEAKAEVERKRAERVKAYEVKQTGLSREEYIANYKAALAGGEDLTGIVSFAKAVESNDNSRALLAAYLKERVESPTSPGGKKLEATTGEEVAEVLEKIYQTLDHL